MKRVFVVPMILTNPRLAALGALVLLATSGCISAPAIAVVNSRTALEIQAGGEFPSLERELTQAGISPRSEEIPREALPPGENGELGELVHLYTEVQSDADWIDEMLLAGCIGESSEGLLAATPSACTESVDQGNLLRIVGRQNLHRRQIWEYLMTLRPGAGVDQIRTTWREVHLQQVICGGLVQVPSGGWEPKSC